MAKRSLIILLLIFGINHVDRQLVAILIEPIKQELGLSDAAAGLLYGLAFTIFYSTFGIPIGWLSDHFNRTRIISASLFLFSAMTAVCGFASTYLQLLLARIGVGVGEAGTNPPSHSIIADLFPQERRSTAMAVFAMGPHLGIVLAFWIGGALGEQVGWRATFWIAGAAGIALMIAARFTLSEPIRAVSERPVSRPGILETTRALWRNPVLCHVVAGATIANTALAALFAWLPAMLMRQHDMTMSATGAWLAFSMGVLGGVGVVCGGWLADRLGARSNVWRLRTCSLGLAIAAPLWALAIASESTRAALAAIALASCLITVHIGPSFSMVQTLSAPHARALSAALLLFCGNLVGVGLGPVAVGLSSDLFEPRYGVMSLSIGLTIVPPLWLWAAYHFERSARHLATHSSRSDASTDRSAPTPDPCAS